MFRIVVCDETRENISYLIGHINKAVKELSIGKSTEVLSVKPSNLANYKIKDNYTYLFFLDTIYKDITGIEIARRIRRQHKNTYIVFVTSHIEFLYMVVNQNLMPSGFFNKPINENDIKKIIADVFDYYNTENKASVQTITISTGSVIYKIPHNEIIYIESLNKKINIYTDKQRISCYNSLASLSEELGNKFVRCHKSFIVNIDKVKNVFMAESYIEMQNGNIISISRTYKSEIKKICSEVLSGENG